MKLPFYIVDVFAEEKYAGNQLAVFLDAKELDSEMMQKIAREINFAESTFITVLQPENNSAEIRIFTAEHEMKFAGHPVIGTSWVLMNKIFESQRRTLKLTVPIGEIPIKQSGDLVWLQAAQPQFLDIFPKEGLLPFSNLSLSDFDSDFPVQEVTTGSAFVIVPLKSKKALENLNLELPKMKEWLLFHCKTNHRALYFYCFGEGKLYSRMLYIESNQIMEDAATGSASTCLQAFLLKYHSAEIKTVNHQGDFINRPSRIYFDGKLSEDYFDIKIGGKTQFIAKGEWEV
ncbi:PhzF family phenazine biosynthesis protein [Flavobacterium gilvum]|uniref:Phenazine biosynthesis protein PhzF n=1 Tax=Flavobacterium gilvum TaxID=1492737 RepID=A0AAC9I2P1_9FLAO|nr:PhzF family phenazine biosynthesis protein [Flavobacterium gilvum]AOW09579.1 phenazine biosynthesis protein PhzF [Flavobacterium gilvum]KFC58999.1 phenazine biosynthesis protein PhzF [Flavobacterium gilvum]